MKGSINNFTVSSDKHLSGARAPITANKAAAPNRRPPFPFAALLPFGYSFCAPPVCRAAVGEPQCWLASRMITTRFLVGLVSLCSVGGLWASPRSDLESPSPATRAAAAAILRASYTPPPRTNWDAFVAALKVGTSKTNVLEKVRPFNAVAESVTEVTSQNYVTEYYRLDDLWRLKCRFHRFNNTLLERKLTQALQCIWVATPPRFTGVWTTYYANGQKAHEIHYKDGQLDGAWTCFGNDGSKLSLHNYVGNILEGEYIDYFPSGRVRSRWACKAGVQVGACTNYNADGSVRPTQQRAKP